MREARKTGDKELMMEVMKAQQKLLPLQAEMQKKTMKPMFITLFIFVGAITWFYDFFVSVPDTRVYFPGFGIVDLLGKGFLFPNWLWLYMFFWAVRRGARNVGVKPSEIVKMSSEDMYLSRLEKLEAEGRMEEIDRLEKELYEMAQK
jgi:hypothetical protein